MRTSLLLLALLLLGACEKRQQLTIGWSTVEPAGEISKTIAQELADEFIIEEKPFASAAELSEAVANGEVDLAILEEPPQAQADLFVLRAMFPSVLHVLAKPDLGARNEGVNSISDLVRGRSVFAGRPGGAGYSLVQLLIELNIFPPVDEFNLLESIFDAEADILVVFGGILSQANLQRLQSYRLISLGNVNEYGRGSWAEGVALRSPNIQPFIIPEGLYPGLGDDATLSLSVRSLLVTHAGLSDQTAYNLLMRIDELMAQIRSIYPLAGRQQANSEAISFNLATHPGAIRYEQREAPGFLERYAETLAFIVTLLLALSSLLLALIRMRKQARKDRIDVYFEEIMKLREEIHTVENKSGVTEKIVALQHKVTTLVSDERIAADNAFIGFLELSNQVLEESRR